MKRRKKYPRQKLAPLGRIISRSVKKLGLEVQFYQQKIIDHWEEIAGGHINAISKPQRFKFQTLFINVADSMWMHQLVFMEEQIKEKINKFARRKLVQKIYFKVGELSENIAEKDVYDPSLKINFLDLTDNSDEMDADRALQNIENPDLKIILKRIMMKGAGADKFRRQNNSAASLPGTTHPHTT